MNIFTLTGTILVDSSKAESSISKTSTEAEGLGSKLKSGIATAVKWGAAIETAAVAVGGAMIAAAKETASNMDTIDKASQRMGVSAESYQELAYQANLCGVEMTTLEKAAKSLEGTDMSFDDAMEQIYSLGTAEERSAKAAELFGDTVAYKMSPMLNASAEDMAAMAQEANDLGLVMDQDTVTAGASMNDMFTKVESSISQLKNSLMADLMPYVMEILQWLLDNMPMITDTVKSVIDALMPIVQAALDLLMEIIPPLFDKIKELMDWLMPYIQPIVEGIKDLIDGIMKLLDGDIDGFIDDVKNAFINLGTALFGIGKDIMNQLWNGIKNIWEGISTWVSEKVSWIANKLQFWKSSASTMNESDIDGSHAAGLNYVPYDGYIAELHKGESVLNAGDTQSMKDDIVNSLKDLIGNAAGISQPIELTLNIDGEAFARATYQYNKAETTRRGTNLVMGV